MSRNGDTEGFSFRSLIKAWKEAFVLVIVVERKQLKGDEQAFGV